MTSRKRFSGKLILVPVVVLAVALLLFYLQGGFSRKIPPGQTEVSPPPTKGDIVTVTRETLPIRLSWPATVVSHTVARIAPKFPGRIIEITVRPGDSVQAGHLLVQLDASQIRAQWQAAQAALASARALAERAEADARRLRNLFAQEAATRQDLDAALAAERSTRAQVEAARHRVEAIRTQLQETELQAPFAGNVIERRADPGDMGLPGQPILVLQDPDRLQVETAVPERCLGSSKVGDPLAVEIPGAQLKLTARITERAAAADPLTHTVLVKAILPAHRSITPGAFAWARQACGKREALLLPATAVRRVGQLEEVTQVKNGVAQVRLVRTGQRHDNRVEILSGLQAGDRVLMPSARAEAE
ncbi:MAG: efflux RND transporter periplasmic adaptor subunit [Methylohalobius sp. ZOD2]